MLPDLYTLITGDSEAAGILEDRVFRHGAAPQGTPTPYATWFLLPSQPQIALAGGPCADANHVQVDIWDEDDTRIEAAYVAVRRAIEDQHHVTQVQHGPRDDTTMRFRITLHATVWSC